MTARCASSICTRRSESSRTATRRRRGSDMNSLLLLALLAGLAPDVKGHKILASKNEPLLLWKGGTRGHAFVEPGGPANVYRTGVELEKAFKGFKDEASSTRIHRLFPNFASFKTQMVLTICVGYRRDGTKLKITGLTEKEGTLIAQWAEEAPPA